jgi:predicted protein tyrosine phosphatase
MHLLFICTYNRWRSLTAERLFANRPGLEVRSAGISATARVKVSPALVKWADIIFVMEDRHRLYLEDTMTDLVEDKQIVCLNIASGYQFNDPELIELLEKGVEEYVQAE